MYTAGKKRRLGTRHPVCLDVELHLKGERRSARTVDVSRHGLFLEVEDPPHERKVVFLTVQAPTGAFETMATVAHRKRGDRQDPVGAGLKFFCMAGEAAERWNRFVSSLEQLQDEPEATRPPPSQAPSSAPGQARFFIQLDGVGDMYHFFNRHVSRGEVVKVAPPLRHVGARVDIVFVHPQSEDEFVLQATVEELYENDPLRMGIRFAPVSPENRREFMTFIGPSSAASEQNPRNSPPLLAAPRRGWTEYAFFSPRFAQAAPEASAAVKQLVASEASKRAPEADGPDLEQTPQPEAAPRSESLAGLEELEQDDALELVEGELRALPELELVDPAELFDFNWKGNE